MKKRNTPCIHENNLLWCSGEDLRVLRVRSCVRLLRTDSFFIYQLKNILRSNLRFSTSYSRSIDLKSLLGLLLVILYGLEKKFHFNIYVSAGWTFIHPMSRRCRHRLCPYWLKTRIKILCKF